MTPDIQERAERLADHINSKYRMQAYPEIVRLIADDITQALLDAHEAGRAEMKEEAARWHPIADAKRNGHHVFLHMPEMSDTPPWQSQGFWSNQRECWLAVDSMGLRPVEPSLFRELPDPPTAIRNIT